MHDAILKDVQPHPFFEKKLIGTIYDDKLGRFTDGAVITTSVITGWEYEDDVLVSVSTKSGTVYKIE
ncbi:hypothetical protein ZPAH1_orf00097 [Aeromonas phage ZPAH1]|nr:hypothetical protein ASwh1_49 [Aeromonas phage Aswh_1]QQG33859.1 hypothetical protein ZPAH1_orf00097 [Aeromonas phage ZPAH1]